MLSSQISYQIIRSSRKTMSLEIKADGSVVVRAPLRLSEAKIQKFVEEKQEWILKNLEKIQKRDAQKENVQKLSALERQHLQNKACVVIPRRVAYYAEKLGVSYGKITLRQQKTRWGSCAANGNLNFNWLLILAPPEVLDYVVVHELCHRREMNHSQAFWKEVEKILPDYRERQKWLKDNGWRLMEEGFYGKKRKKMVRFAYCNRIFMCILCTGSGCVQASQITGKRHTACKQQWEKSTA